MVKQYTSTSKLFHETVIALRDAELFVLFFSVAAMHFHIY